MIKPQLIYPFCSDEHEVISEFGWHKQCSFDLVHVCACFCWTYVYPGLGLGATGIYIFSVRYSLMAAHLHSHHSTSSPTLGTVTLLGKNILKCGTSLWYFWLVFPHVLVDISLVTLNSISVLCVVLWSVILSFFMYVGTCYLLGSCVLKYMHSALCDSPFHFLKSVLSEQKFLILL